MYVIKAEPCGPEQRAEEANLALVSTDSAFPSRTASFIGAVEIDDTEETRFGVEGLVDSVECF